MILETGHFINHYHIEIKRHSAVLNADDRNPYLEDDTYNPLQQILTSIANEERSVRMAKLQVALSELTDKERSAIINIGGDEYMLLLTTKATKEIAGRYGGLENLGDKLMKSENFEMAIGEIVWLITLLANQSILVHNLKNKDDKKEVLTEEMVELLTTPLDLADYKVAITEALCKGTKRNIQSEDNSKNAAVG